MLQSNPYPTLLKDTKGGKNNYILYKKERGTVFYASTGLHGLHVIVGTIFILVGFIRIINYHLTDSHHLGYEAAIFYLHLVL